MPNPSTIAEMEAEMDRLKTALNAYSEDETLRKWEAEIAELRESEARLLRIIRDFRASNERLKAFSVELLRRLERKHPSSRGYS